MSYNGIGLKSAKGSSTSGHIQRSLASDNEKTSLLNYKARKLQRERKTSRDKDTSRVKKVAHFNRDGAHKDVIAVQQSLQRHKAKRQIELQVSELRDQLEDAREDQRLEITDEEIDKRCNLLRAKLNQEAQERERFSKLYKSRKEREQEEDKDDTEESES